LIEADVNVPTVRISVYGSKDPDPYQNVTNLENWYPVHTTLQVKSIWDGMLTFEIPTELLSWPSFCEVYGIKKGKLIQPEVRNLTYSLVV
jgi:hypothetical protein